MLRDVTSHAAGEQANASEMAGGAILRAAIEVAPIAARSDAPEQRGMSSLWRGRLAASATAFSREPLVSRVLRARGIVEPAVAERFLEPRLTHLHDPSLIPDLDKAAERLLRAARDGEKIAIYGDYDVDGVTATAILFHTLRELFPGVDVVTYVPHRLEEGYGLNSNAIRELAQAGARVIVSVDCGVTAIGPALVARECGVDLIITDHHNPPATLAELPDAFAVVHPRRPGSVYPFGELCGAGVAFKLAWRMATLASGGPKVGERIRTRLMDMLALASLGVIADVVPLVDENRAMAKFGLSRVRYSEIEGLRALVDAAGLGDEKISAMDAGFKLGPRLNACGRMGHAREAVELLTVATGARAREIAAQLTALNDQRREIERAIFREACEMAEASGMTREDRRAIVLAAPGWHQGVVGIVCSRMVERYHRPTILMNMGETHCHGSGRSVDGFSLHGALAACAGHLTQFGGHDMAAGLKLGCEKLAAFAEAFIEQANAGIEPSKLVGRVVYDCDAGVHELDPAGVDALARLGPFGRENPDVRLCLRGLKIATRPETFGKLNAHLSLQVEASDASGRAGRPLRLIAWKWGGKAAAFRRGMTLDAIISPRISEWGGKRRVEAEIVDVRV